MWQASADVSVEPGAWQAVVIPPAMICAVVSVSAFAY